VVLVPVYKNMIAMDVDAFINTATNVTANELTLIADDRSSITAIVGAASVAASLGGTAGVSVSIGVALAFNQIDTDVSAYIDSVETMDIGTGGITVTATSLGEELFSFGGISADTLDDAATQDSDDDETTNTNEATVDEEADKLLLTSIKAKFTEK
jgi:hypothetical protein